MIRRIWLSVLAMLLCGPATAENPGKNLRDGPIHMAQASPSDLGSGALLQRTDEVGCAPPAASERRDITAALPGDRFVAAEHFEEEVGSDADVQIVWLGESFRRQFLQKVEIRSGPVRLRVHTLRRSARDSEIIAALDDRHETELVHLWCLLWQQPKGEPGTLLNTAVPNIFYIRDPAGRIWAVDAVWGGAGWEIGASATDDQRPWGAGRRVFSR